MESQAGREERRKDFVCRALSPVSISLRRDKLTSFIVELGEDVRSRLGLSDVNWLHRPLG